METNICIFDPPSSHVLSDKIFRNRDHVLTLLVIQFHNRTGYENALLKSEFEVRFYFFGHKSYFSLPLSIKQKST